MGWLCPEKPGINSVFVSSLTTWDAIEKWTCCDMMVLAGQDAHIGVLAAPGHCPDMQRAGRPAITMRIPTCCHSIHRPIGADGEENAMATLHMIVRFRLAAT